MNFVKSSQPLILKAALMAIALTAIEQKTKKTKEKMASMSGGGIFGEFLMESQMAHVESEAHKFAEENIEDHYNKPINLDAVICIDKDESMREEGVAIIEFHAPRCTMWKYTDLNAFDSDYAQLERLIENNAVSL